MSARPHSGNGYRSAVCASGYVRMEDRRFPPINSLLDTRHPASGSRTCPFWTSGGSLRYMGRRRQRDKHLPQRVYRKHGRFWYVDRENKWRDLGLSDSDMYRELSKLAARSPALTTMSGVFDKYLLERLPLLAPRTQRDYRGYLRNLRL